MRIGFVERMASQTMATKGVSRNAALMRHALIWSVIGSICLAIWVFAPIEKITVERRGTDVPLDFMLVGCGALFIGMALMFVISRENPKIP